MKKRYLPLVPIILLTGTAPANSQSALTWFPGQSSSGNGVWSTSAANWTTNQVDSVAWSNSSNAIFSGTGDSSVALGNASLTANAVSLATGANVTLTSNAARTLAASATTLGSATFSIGTNVTYAAPNQNLGGSAGAGVSRLIQVFGNLSSSSGGSMGGGNGSTTTLNVNAGGNFTGGTGFVVGSGGGNATHRSTASLSVNSGGTATVPSGNLVLSNVANANSTLTVSAGGVATIGSGASNGIRFFASGSGATNNATATVNLDGGTLTATSIYRTASGNATGRFNFNGGTLRVASSANQTAFMSGNISAVVGAGGAVIDTNGRSINLGLALTDGGAGGGLTKIGSGTLTLAGTNSYTGVTDVSAGVLALGSGASLSATSGFRFDLTSSLPLGTVDFGTASFDYSGKSLELALTENLGSGGTYNLFTGSGSYTGNFSSLVLTGFNASGYMIDSFDAANGSVMISAVPEPGLWGLMTVGLLGVLAFARRRTVRN